MLRTAPATSTKHAAKKKKKTQEKKHFRKLWQYEWFVFRATSKLDDRKEE